MTENAKSLEIESDRSRVRLLNWRNGRPHEVPSIKRVDLFELISEVGMSEETLKKLSSGCSYTEYIS